MTPGQKQLTFLVVVVIVVSLNEIATAYGVQMLTLLPLLLAVAFVGFWAFVVK